tara:strand:- start:1479 stop:1772 length:294 start_codon:yes stop_codon:yes gene_type:complete
MSETDIELIFNMDEDFICPEEYQGHEIVSYMQLGRTRWFRAQDFQCNQQGCDSKEWTDETYAMFTSDFALVPCKGCGRFSIFEVKPHIEGISLRRKR